VLVDTKSPVPVLYVTGERHPNGPPGYPGAVLTVAGTTNLVISVADKEPRRVTFLVVAANTDAEIHIVTLNYSEFDLEPASFFPPVPVHWPGQPEGDTTRMIEPHHCPCQATLNISENGTPAATGMTLPQRSVGQLATPSGRPRVLDWLWCDELQIELHTLDQGTSAMTSWHSRASHSPQARVNETGPRILRPSTGRILGDPPLRRT